MKTPKKSRSKTNTYLVELPSVCIEQEMMESKNERELRKKILKSINDKISVTLWHKKR